MIGISYDLFGQAAAWYCDAGLLALGDAVTSGGRRIKCLAAAAKRAIRVDDVHVVAFLKYPIKIVVLKSSVHLLHPLPQGRDSLRGVVGMCFRNTGRKTRRSIYTTSLNGGAMKKQQVSITCARIPVLQMRGAGELAGAQRARGEPSLSVWPAKHAIARSAKGLRQQTRSHVQARPPLSQSPLRQRSDHHWH